MENKNLEAELYNIATNYRMDYRQFEAIKTKVYEAIVAYENAEFYDVLRQLRDSINNAGWEKRHSEQIDLINKTSAICVEKSERLLP